MKLSDIYLFSDVDGTLYSHVTRTIPENNLEAIRRFIAKGGKFGLATGRSATSARDILEKVPISAPCLCVNGGGVYDTGKKEYIHTWFLPPQALEYTKMLIGKYPHIDAAVLCENDDYIYVADPEIALGRMYMKDKLLNIHIKEPIPGNLFKVLFHTKDEECQQILAEMEAMDLPGVRFTSSDTYFIEMLPLDSSKGNAILALCEMFGLQVSQTVAIGDYYNDLEMLHTAGFSACVAGAPDDIKCSVDVVLCDCQDGALAQLIELLEERYDG